MNSDDYPKKILFFGYGANRNKNKLIQVLGHSVGEGVGAVLEGYVLVYQTISQLPEHLRNFFAETYGHNFKAYTLRAGEGVVSGTIWEIDEKDLEILKEWEFVPEWREVVEVIVLSAGGKEVQVLTEKSKDEFQFHEITDGVNYEEFNFPRLSKDDPKQELYYTKQQIERIKGWLEQQSKK